MALCRELTKKFEEFIRGTICEVIDGQQNQEISGEFCLIIERRENVMKKKKHWWEGLYDYRTCRPLYSGKGNYF